MGFLLHNFPVASHADLEESNCIGPKFPRILLALALPKLMFVASPCKGTWTRDLSQPREEDNYLTRQVRNG